MKKIEINIKEKEVMNYIQKDLDRAHFRIGAPSWYARDLYLQETGQARDLAREHGLLPLMLCYRIDGDWMAFSIETGEYLRLKKNETGTPVLYDLMDYRQQDMGGYYVYEPCEELMRRLFATMDWSDCEAALRHPLPENYKKFIDENYGTRSEYPLLKTAYTVLMAFYTLPYCQASVPVFARLMVDLNELRLMVTLFDTTYKAAVDLIEDISEIVDYISKDSLLWEIKYHTYFHKPNIFSFFDIEISLSLFFNKALWCFHSTPAAIQIHNGSIYWEYF